VLTRAFTNLLGIDDSDGLVFDFFFPDAPDSEGRPDEDRKEDLVGVDPPLLYMENE
jgi:hypothetical protein